MPRPRFLVAAAAALLATQVFGQAGTIPDASAAIAAGAQAPSGSTAAPEPQFYPDIEPAQCALGYNCSAEKGMPLHRGVCVQATNPGSGNACWDVCNPNHLARSFKVSSRGKEDQVIDAAVRSLVQAARAGMNPIIKCPGNFGGDPCPPGEACPSTFLSEFNVPEGRGLCVLDETKATDRSCWDVCDYRHSVPDFTMGTTSGVEDKIYAARSSSTCPGLQWWQIFLIVVFFLLVCICLGGVGFIAKNHLAGKKKGGSSSAGSRPFEAEPRDFKDDCPEMQEDDAEGGDYGQDQVHSREMQPPPSPPRGQHSSSREVLLGESYGPPPEEPPRGYYAESPGPSRDASMPNPPQYTQSHPQPQSQDLLGYSQPHQEPIMQEPPFNPSGGEMPQSSNLGATTGVKIPGLDEPNLLGHLAMGQMTGSAFQTQVPHSPFMAHGIVPQNTQPGQTSFNFAPGQQAALQQPVMPSFHTQLPSMYQGVASPPSSVQLQPAGAQQFFR